MVQIYRDKGLTVILYLYIETSLGSLSMFDCSIYGTVGKA